MADQTLPAIDPQFRPVMTYDDLPEDRRHEQLPRSYIDAVNATVQMMESRPELVDHEARALCCVPGCGIRSRHLEDGMCPVALWDERHELYAGAEPSL